MKWNKFREYCPNEQIKANYKQNGVKVNCKQVLLFWILVHA